MFDTNDVYNDAVRGSTLHTEESSDAKESLMGTKVVSTLLLTGIAYAGFSLYMVNPINEDLVVRNEALVVKNELVAEIQTKSETLVKIQSNDSEEEYLSALRAIETELTEERESISLDTNEQMSLSSAMNDLMNDTILADNTGYTNKLRKEIGVDEVVYTDTDIVVNSTNEDSRSVIVKKGDTLQGISNKFYGDAMNYKRIIASNDSLNANDTIYVGQTILLPY